MSRARVEPSARRAQTVSSAPTSGRDALREPIFSMISCSAAHSIPIAHSWAVLGQPARLGLVGSGRKVSTLLMESDHCAGSGGDSSAMSVGEPVAGCDRAKVVAVAQRRGQGDQRRGAATPCTRTVDDVGVGADRAGVAGSSRPVPDDAGHCARAASRLSRRAFLVAENVAGYVRNTPRLIRVTGWCICPANRCSARLRPAEWRLSVSSRGVGVVE